MIRSQVSCIPIRNNKIAVIKKNNTRSSTHLKWIPAGGHVEHGETLEEACIREIKEETGLKINNPRIKGIVSFIGDTGYHSICTFFVDHEPIGEIDITEENIEVEWIDINDIMESDEVTFYHEYVYRRMLIENQFFNIVLKFNGNNPIPKLIENDI